MRETAQDVSPGLSPALVETIAGLSAGSIATLVVHPLDIVKTRMQIYRASTATATGGGGGAAPLTTVGLLRSLVQSHQGRGQSPIAAMYRGLTPNLLGNAASWSSFFFFKSRFERAILSLKEGGEEGNQQQEKQQQPQQLTPTDYFISSGLAGLAVQTLTNPIWVLKTRMLSSNRGDEGAYASMAEGARRVLREEGWRGFYRGLGVSLLGVSHGAVQFAVYEPAKRLYLVRRQQQRRRRLLLEQEQQQKQQKQKQQRMDSNEPTAAAAQESESSTITVTNEATLVLSTAAKLVAGAATYPYQVVRSRLQNYDAESRFGRGIVGVARLLWREDGVRGFYRGLVPGVVRVLPATWVTFLVYENVKFYLGERAAV